MKPIKVGVLALQGAFIEHEAMLQRLNAEHFEIRQRKDLDRPFDALILPGGESTVMSKLLKELNLFDTLLKRIEAGLPVFGTCAGLILLAKDVECGVPCFGSMDICAKRNAYGRQLGSFYTESEFDGLGVVPMTFIRAPYIQSAGSNVQVLAEADGHIVAAKQDNMLVTAFHPELSDDIRVHKYFIDMAKS